MDGPAVGYAFESRPLTPVTWADVEVLFDLSGGSIVRGCWCTYYRSSGKVGLVQRGCRRGPQAAALRSCGRAALRSRGRDALRSRSTRSSAISFDAGVVPGLAGVVPGLIGYIDGDPAGWISLGPREDYAKLARSPIMKPVDDRDVWSVVCTDVAKRYRGHGVQRRLVEAAIRYAAGQKVRILEVYPVDKPQRSHDDFMFFGSRALYGRAGFTEVVRRSPTRVVMRRNL